MPTINCRYPTAVPVPADAAGAEPGGLRRLPGADQMPICINQCLINTVLGCRMTPASADVCVYAQMQTLRGQNLVDLDDCLVLSKWLYTDNCR
jgi:hypothetical protein